MGWENVFHCEWNEFGQKVLKYYWPKAISYHDITKTDFTIHRGQIDILTGGFPCQPYSAAGKRRGTEDARHLWPEMLRAIREIQPAYIVAENVRGLTNWNGGMVFNQVQADMEAEGYEVTPFLLPACAVNAPHRRDRIWFVAHCINDRHSSGREKKGGEDKISGVNREEMGGGEFNGASISRTTPHSMLERHSKPTGGANHNKERKVCKEEQGDGDGIRPKVSGHSGPTPDTGLLRSQEYEEQTTGIEQRNKGDAPDTGCKGREGSQRGGTHGERDGEETFRPTAQRFEIPTWDNWPTQSPLRERNDGLSDRLVGITIPKHRNESIKGYGNAIVPALAMEIFKAIQFVENGKQWG